MARKERRRKNSGLRLAEQACRLTSYKEATPLGTLAAAYAEAGRFADAATAAQKAIALAMATGNTQFANINQQLLRLTRRANRTTCRRQPPGLNESA